ncbi:CehA/McbA family metallohydrolase [Paenibacillus filicis]|uniref:CehA/McbA family metallohydrolase n=1 Tax=Paenibacillus gyeongsangnamensis TaxID=3388067 RepID=A0ABT4QJS0_9BACL|nr:CehA/McbA family metallohydrolase [Paenibacillus filicis]MCZ8517129.1 CehA/McbA family metallohydrolase [Paenibacillus filicis]
MAKNTERRRSTAVYTRQIKKEEQSGYVELPFEMPEGVEEIHVAYEFVSHGETKAVIDLGIRDGSRVRGWSGGARSEFRMARHAATPGYMPGPLEPGGWAVLHNAYKVPEEGCLVTVTIEFIYKTPRWLKGDLHTHSEHSDGSFTLEENAAIMESLGCDFIAMTDHNTISQNLAYPRHTNVLMIPGTEFTTNFGHSNFLGVTDPMDDFRVSGQADVEEKLRTARSRGAKIVLNHPHCDWCPWEWGFSVEHDWVEIWNGPWSARNARTLAWWQEQLAAGRRLAAVGGSDVHRPDPFVKHAMPCTWVWAESKTVESILAGIDRGHVLITYAPDGPFSELGCEAYRMGDVVPLAAKQREVLVRAEDLHSGDRVLLISDRGVERETVVAYEGSLEWKEASEGRLFLRVEIWRYFEEAGEMLLAALTNPLYFERLSEEG